MLMWGPLAFMPLVHNLQTLHLVRQPGLALGWGGAAAWVLFGFLMIWVNYDADTQRHRVRAANGKCDVWGKPAEFIRATYKTNDGKQHESLLLVCGWHQIARHFHYVPDIVLLCLYTFPSNSWSPLPHLYTIYLTTLLVDRTFRIDARCHAKYGKFWEEYVERVPWKLVPGVF